VKPSALVFVAILALALPACNRGGAPTPHDDGGAQGRPDRKLVVARVGESTITVGDVEDELNKLHPSVRARFMSPERRKEFVKNLVRFDVLAREARRRGLDKDPEVIKRVKRAMIDVMMVELRSSLVKMEDITDKDVETYYNEHINVFRQPPKVRASVIVVATRAEAAALMTKAKKKPGDVKAFGDLAVAHSIDPATKVKRGDLGFFSRDDEKVEKELREAAFKQEAMWSVSEPVKVARGWAILMKTGDVAEVNRPLQMERDRIKNRLFNERRLQAVERYVDELQSKAKVEIIDKNLSKVEVKDAPHAPSSMSPRGPH
jgi:peptidyl-prolyl cis-trans isomerase C